VCAWCCSHSERGIQAERTARHNFISREQQRMRDISRGEAAHPNKHVSLYRLIVLQLTFSIVNHKTQCTWGDPSHQLAVPPPGHRLLSWLKFIILCSARRWIQYLIMPSGACRERVFECTLRRGLIPLLSLEFIYKRAAVSRFAIRCCISLYIYSSLCVVKSSVQSAPSGVVIIVRRLHCAFDA